jgi:hypothetical protein
MNLTMNEEYLLFNYELGSTIAQWSSVEHALAFLATACVGPAEYANITSGYFGIENFRSKREFVSRMVQSVAAEREDLLDAWALLDTRITRASEVRNQIVHRSLSIYGKAPIGRRYALIEFAQTLKERGGIVLGQPEAGRPPSGAICLHQLVEAQSRFFGVNVSLWNFRETLHGNPKPIPESYEQGSEVPDLLGLDTRFRAALGLPPRPSRRSRAAPGDAAAEKERETMDSAKTFVVATVRGQSGEPLKGHQP